MPFVSITIIDNNFETLCLFLQNFWYYRPGMSIETRNLFGAHRIYWIKPEHFEETYSFLLQQNTTIKNIEIFEDISIVPSQWKHYDENLIDSIFLPRIYGDFDVSKLDPPQKIRGYHGYLEQNDILKVKI